MNPLMRRDGDLDSLCLALLIDTEADVPIHEPNKGLYSIENGFKLPLNS
jgi:hypothetical protein